MSSPTPGSDPNAPQGGAPQGQPAWGAPPPPPAPGHGSQGYNPAPAYSGPSGPPAGQKPGMVTAAGIIGIVWGALGLLFGLLALSVAFSLLGAVYGLLVLISVVLSGALLYAGILVVQGKSPRLLLLLSYVSIGINLLVMIWGATQGASVFSSLLGFIVPGVIVFLLLNAQTKQYYASQGISY
ncbi:hypothetical protein [Blastococcus sp. PRF04-17]|uniref:hypothetical protein n=1 Tax=Blastococcus sp. PRF04-17 TaxID=2933797 RepID=UPI001FF6E39C|nr:hypothetical protein [Blastococcus sp. PRF04-17]UOY01466.1 hypothetical protein MVA48_21425 [Blastococcus sp. PRF04-17]